MQGLVSWGAHDPGTEMQCNPPDLAEEIENRFGSYPVEEFLYCGTWNSEKCSDQVAQRLIEATELRADATEWLLRDRLADWDLGIVVVSELHSATEALWHGVDQQHPLHVCSRWRKGIEGVYEALDSMLGRLQSAFPDTALLLFSPHGMGANDSDVASMWLLSELLYRRHFARPLLDVKNEDSTKLVQIGENESWIAHVRGQKRHSEPTARQRLKRKLHKYSKADGRRKDTGHSLDWIPTVW